MKLTNRYHLPAPIVEAIKADTRPKLMPYDYSVTGLIQPAQIAHLKREHRTELVEDVSDMLRMLHGRVFHQILAEYANLATDVVEEPAYASIDGIHIVGIPDRYIPSQGLLQDWKGTKVFFGGPKGDWVAQLNMLVWILRQNGREVKKAQVVNWFQDWKAGNRNHAERSATPILTLDVPLWDQEKVEAYIRTRIDEHRRADQMTCSDEERWYNGEKWALMKKGKKRAVKLYGTERDAAEAYGDSSETHYVGHRPGRYARCEGYCPVSNFCEQWREEHAANV